MHIYAYLSFTCTFPFQAFHNFLTDIDLDELDMYRHVSSPGMLHISLGYRRTSYGGRVTLLVSRVHNKTILRIKWKGKIFVPFCLYQMCSPGMCPAHGNTDLRSTIHLLVPISTEYHITQTNRCHAMWLSAWLHLYCHVKLVKCLTHMGCLYFPHRK